MPTPIDISGQRFGRLTVLRRAPGLPRWKGKWLCRCDCGTEKLVWAPHMKAGATASCGCLHREQVARLSAAKVTHGMTQSTEYGIWGGMLDRCANPRSGGYARYGGRGIVVCERWHSFENFFADMGERPSKRHSLDRIDNEGNYEPGNCRWTTSAVQSRNRRDNALYSYGGRTMALCDWADESGLNRQTVYWRFRKGWRGHRLFSRP
jgi:hypothetical protein